MGVLFLYFVVLPVVLQFFITFNRAFGPPDLGPNAFQSLLLAADQKTPDEVIPPASTGIRLLHEDPADAKAGDQWVNATTRRLMIQTPNGVWSTALEPGPVSPALQSQFAIDQYISFVLLLALAFGITFETPIVVVFLAWSGIVPTKSMAASRRYVIMGVIVASAIMTPSADVLNQMLLAGPMYVLFELGLAAARLIEKGKTAG